MTPLRITGLPALVIALTYFLVKWWIIAHIFRAVFR